MWNYGLISAQIDRAVAADYNLSAATVVLCLSALSKMASQFSWEDDGLIVDDETFDDIDNWISTAILELITPGASTPMTLKTGVLSHIESTGTAGGSVSAGSNLCPLNTIEENSDSLITDLDSNSFKVSTTGRYLINVKRSHHQTGYSTIGLHTDSYFLCDGEASSGTASVATLNTIETLTADTWYRFYLYATSGQSTNGFGVALSVAASGERYMTVVLTLLEETS
jgi:hypothetical protein